METTVKERLITFIKYKRISMRSFEIRSGLSNGYLRQLRSSPSIDKVESIINAFPELNRGWLLSGEGEMLRSETPSTSESSRMELELERESRELFRMMREMMQLMSRQMDIMERRMDAIEARYSLDFNLMGKNPPPIKIDQK